MVSGKHKSRTLRRVYVKTPGGRTTLHYKKRKPAKAKCGSCGAVLKGVARERPYKMKNLSALKSAIRKAKSVAIFSHINPDGDSIGSLLSLGLGMEQLKKKVYMISQDGVPRKYKSLPGADRIIRSTQKPIDLAIAVDCGAPRLLGKSYSIFRRAGQTAAIDHHDFRDPFEDLLLLFSSLSVDLVHQDL